MPLNWCSDVPGDCEGAPLETILQQSRSTYDWFDAAGCLVADPSPLADVEAEAAALAETGVQHVIWAGMGGSVVPVQALLGVLGGGRITVHPLDSTAPAAVDALAATLAASVSEEPALAQALQATVMVAVAMGMTSEEPIGHLRWFAGLLQEAGLRASDHIRVLTVPGSALQACAQELGVPHGTVCFGDEPPPPGRMSAPAYRPFLLALALAGRRAAQPFRLPPVMRRAWQLHALDQSAALDQVAEHRFVRLAQQLSAASRGREQAGAGSAGGVVRMLLSLPEGWDALHPYVEQLLEQSLGKSGAGIVVFRADALDDTHAGTAQDPSPETDLVRVSVLAHNPAPGQTPAGLAERASTPPAAGAAGSGSAPVRELRLYAPELAATKPQQRAVALIAHILGWQLLVAVYGSHHDLPIATEPAVEAYKAYSKALRAEYGAGASPWADTDPQEPLLIDTAGARHTENLAGRLAEQLRQSGLRYLDVTVNAELSPPDRQQVWSACRQLAGRLGVPVKLRRAPADYHVSEQAQMDGPAGVFSLRVVPREIAAARHGRYDGAFATAAAVATQRAMREAGRDCLLLVTAGAADALPQALVALLNACRSEIP